MSHKVRIKKLPKLTQDGKRTGKWRYIVTAVDRHGRYASLERTSWSAALLAKQDLHNVASLAHEVAHPNDKRHVQIVWRKALRAAGTAVARA